MNIGEDRVMEINGVIFHENIDNYIKTDKVKEEPNGAEFPIKCETCNENSDNEKVCKHYKYDRPGNVEDDKLQKLRLFSANNLQEISDMKTKIENTNCSSSQKQEDSLIDTGITIKEEEYLDNPEYLSMNIDLVESQTGRVKTEDEDDDDDDDIFHENGKIAEFKEELTDYEPTLRSNVLVQDEISFVDVKPDFLEDSQEGFKRKPQMDRNNCTIDEVLKKHSSNAAEKPRRCPICPKTFSRNYQLIVHERTHTGERPFQCNVCSKWFPCKYQMVAHRKAHTGDIRFQCKICPKRFSRSSVFETHQRTHTGERPFQCETCLGKFYTNGQLSEHRKRHVMEKTFQCTFCSKSFIRKSRLVIHRRTHTGERPFQCTLCSRSFIQLNYLNAHKRIHDVQNPYTCKVCLKSFSDNSLFTTHSRIHTGEKPYECEVCSKSFIRRGELISHERIHNGERPYKCEVCSKSYSSRSAFGKHKKTHAEGEK